MREWHKMDETTTYLSVTDTAKLVRKLLAKHFPSVKFSVRSRSYSGGASISVHWTDGPRRQAVERIVNRYEGADFDGMQDLKTYKRTLLVGEDGPREFQFGADFIFCSRDLSRFDELRAEADRIIRARCEVDRFDRVAGDFFVCDLARAMAHDLDFTTAETLEAAFRRVVLREDE